MVSGRKHDCSIQLGTEVANLAAKMCVTLAKQDEADAESKFMLAEPGLVRDRGVIIVDDVYRTGDTMRDAAHPLLFPPSPPPLPPPPSPPPLSSPPPPPPPLPPPPLSPPPSPSPPPPPPPPPLLPPSSPPLSLPPPPPPPPPLPPPPPPGAAQGGCTSGPWPDSHLHGQRSNSAVVPARPTALITAMACSRCAQEPLRLPDQPAAVICCDIIIARNSQ